MLKHKTVYVSLAIILPVRLHLTQSIRSSTISWFLPPILFSNILPYVHFALASVASLLLIKHARAYWDVKREEGGQCLQSHVLK